MKTYVAFDNISMNAFQNKAFLNTRCRENKNTF